MTLREFIEQERRECHVFDVEEFGEKLKSLNYEGDEEIPVENFEEYLDHDIEQATVKHYFGKHYYFLGYEISIMYE